jgi:formyltetrahydrofolate synthetase
MTKTVHAPISVGELIDKITILQIKEHEFDDEIKLSHVRNEMRELNKLVVELGVNVSAEMAELRLVNEIIWINEDAARKFPIYDWTAEQTKKIAEIAMKTYAANTRRAQIKKRINEMCGSTIVEEKSYT